jgi:hypothetical protein
VRSFAQFDVRPQLGEREYVVRLVNPPALEGGRDFQLQHLTDIYTIPAGTDTIVPWAVMVDFLGNPFSYDTARAQERAQNVKQIQMRYGVYDDEVEWERRKPTLQAYSVVTGERITSVVDDPRGEKLASQSTARDRLSAPVSQQLQAMQQQIALLTAKLAAEGHTVPGDPTSTPPAPGAGSSVVAPAGPTSNTFTAPPGPGITTPATAPQVFDAPPANAVPLPATPDVAQGALPDEPGQPQVTP